MVMAGYDKIGKETGPGRIANEMVSGKDVVCSYVLFNYNIDGNVLKPEHREFLDREVVPLLRDHGFHAKLTGTASKSGDREYNRQLSLGRGLRVKQYLLKKGIPESKVPGPDIMAAGEDLSTAVWDEDEWDRAVHITIKVGIKPLPLWPTIVIPVVISPNGPDPIDPPKPGPVPAPDDPDEHWTIRQIYGHNYNVGVGAGVPLVGVGIGMGPIQYSFLLVNR